MAETLDREKSGTTIESTFQPLLMYGCCQYVNDTIPTFEETVSFILLFNLAVRFGWSYTMLIKGVYKEDRLDFR